MVTYNQTFKTTPQNEGTRHKRKNKEKELKRVANTSKHRIETRTITRKTWEHFKPTGQFLLLDVLRDPFKAVTIAHFADNAAHEHLQWTNTSVSQVNLAFARGNPG